MANCNPYVPIRKTRAAECAALANLYPIDKARLTPLLEIIRPSLEDKPPKDLMAHLIKHTKSIQISWGTEHPFFVDHRDIDPSARITNDQHPFNFTLKQLYALGTKPIPVTGPERNDDYNAAILGAMQGIRRDFMIRIPRDYLVSPERLMEEIERIRVFFGARYTDIHILFDNKSIFDHDYAKWARINVHAINSLPHIKEFGSVIMGATGLPSAEILSETVGPERCRELTRYEFEKLWTCILSQDPERKPYFSDYGIRHPMHIRFNSTTMPVTPTVWYALESSWLVARKSSNWTNPRENEQFLDLAKDMADHPKFRGGTFSAGDKFIEEIAAGRRHHGRQQDWVSAGMNRHLTFVAQQISKYAIAEFQLPSVITSTRGTLRPVSLPPATPVSPS